MRAQLRIAWRAAAVAAFAATAVLAVTLTKETPLHAALASARNVGSAARGAASRPASRHHAAPARCDQSGLEISIAAAASSTSRTADASFPLEFTNVSDTTCTLTGYPSVSAYLPGGIQAGNPAGRQASVTVRLIVLAPGATAHATLLVAARPGRCRPVAAVGFRVLAPGQSVPRYLPHALTACSATGRAAPVFLRVRALQPGTGLPVRRGSSS